MTTVSTIVPWVIATMSGETPMMIWSGLDCSSRNAKSSAPTAIPIGLLRPSSAIAMPAKPRPDWKVEPYL